MNKPLPNPVFPTVEDRRNANPPRCIYCAMHPPTQSHHPDCTRPRKATR